MLTIIISGISRRLKVFFTAASALIANLPLLDRYLLTPRMRVGRWGEAVALRTILRAGMTPLKTNWRAQRGELDIIGFDHRTLVAIEVKTRHASLKRRHAAIRAIHAEKRIRLVKVRAAFERNNGPLCRRYAVHHRRIDAIEVYYTRTRFGFLRICEVRWHRSLALPERNGVVRAG